MQQPLTYEQQALARASKKKGWVVKEVASRVRKFEAESTRPPESLPKGGDRALDQNAETEQKEAAEKASESS